MNAVFSFNDAGGAVENAILSRDGLQRYADSPGLDALRGQLMGILNYRPGQTSSLLGSHQQELSRNLEQYIQDQTTEPRSSWYVFPIV